MTRAKSILTVLFIGCLFVGTVLLNVLPWHPSSLGGWITFVVLGVPAYFLITGAGEWLFSQIESRGPGKYVHERTAQQSFSWLRIGYALVAALVVGGAAAGVFVAVRSLIR